MPLLVWAVTVVKLLVMSYKTTQQRSNGDVLVRWRVENFLTYSNFSTPCLVTTV
jgi:hypothetical protein